MKLIFLLLLLPSLALAEGDVYTAGAPGTHPVTCDPPTARQDGTPLAESELLANTLYIKRYDSSGNEAEELTVEVMGTTCDYSVNLENLQSGQWRIYADAVDLDGRHSTVSEDYSPFLLAAPPNAPTGIRKRP